MIQIIHGAKGSGKTKQIIDSANNSAENAKGIVVYIDKDSGRIHDLDNSIRLVDAVSYGVASGCSLLSFVKGMLAGNFDIEKIYIDGVAKIAASKLADMQCFFDGIAEVSAKYEVDFVVTVSCDKADLPPFVAKLV